MRRGCPVRTALSAHSLLEDFSDVFPRSSTRLLNLWLLQSWTGCAKTLCDTTRLCQASGVREADLPNHLIRDRV